MRKEENSFLLHRGDRERRSCARLRENFSLLQQEKTFVKILEGATASAEEFDLRTQHSNPGGVRSGALDGGSSGRLPPH